MNLHDESEVVAVTQQPGTIGRKPKRPERPSAGRRSIEAMALHALKTGAASSVDDLLDQVAAISGRKLFNALLAILQMPHATMLCAASDWEQKWRRRVKPDERPLVLLFPWGPVEFVYDVSQTEATDRARPLPINATPFAMDGFHDAGELVGRLRSAVQELGVRVVTARQGVALAGRIRRTGDGGTLRLPPKKAPSEVREVAVRWILSLNEAHSPSEQLAALAHEIGHLFCGHVGADQGDFWPYRDLSDEVATEFEAESVARLVFRRVAPGVELPPYLDRILDPEAPPPDHGWTYVAQAADRILEMLNLGDRAQATEVSAASLFDARQLPSRAHDLLVRPGGCESTEVILVRATRDDRGLPERVGAAWAEGVPGVNTPWVAVARSEESFNGVLCYFKHAHGEDPEHDELMGQLLELLPLHDHWTTVVSAGQADQEVLIEMSADPPNHGGDAVAACMGQVKRSGLGCVEPELDTSWMYNQVEYATGDLGHEQVLGWDDMYTDEAWRSLSSFNRLFVSIRPDANLEEPKIVELVASAISAGRRDLDDYYAGNHGDDFEEGGV